MILVSDLRPGNFVRTEHGICRVAFTAFGDVYVFAKDNRVNFAREVEGIGMGEIDILKVGETLVAECLRKWLFVHELQNWFYWTRKQELELNL